MPIVEALTSPLPVAGLFFLVALVYSSVGLGGGSSYTALMVLLGFSPLAIPTLSLSLNLVATSAGCYNFIRNGHARFGLIFPFLLSSMPMAYVGGALRISADVFYWVLLVSMVFVAARIYLWDRTSFALRYTRGTGIVISLVAGAILGLVAGIAGIGGGIYLVPLILVLGLGNEKEAAASGAIFIWLNSATGLVARAQFNAIDFSAYVPVLVAVLLGGLLGSYLGAFRFSPRVMERILGVVVLLAIVLLGRKVIMP